MNTIGTHKRPLFLPKRLFASFERHVRHETARNIEVMGIAMGKVYRNGKKVNRVIIPDQTGTATTCTITSFGETQMVEAALEYNETILGWFHTHPRHDNVLSSVCLL